MARVKLSKSDIKRGAIKEVEIEGMYDNGDIGYIMLRPLSTGTVMAFQREFKAVENDTNKEEKQYQILRRVMAEAIVEDDGTPIFTQDEADDIPFPIFSQLQPVMLSQLGMKIVAKDEDAEVDGSEPAAATYGPNGADTGTGADVNPLEAIHSSAPPTD